MVGFTAGEKAPAIAEYCREHGVLINVAGGENIRIVPPLVIENRDMRVRPGMFARVVMSFGVKDHVVVPDQAIVKQVGSGERFVYVYNDGKVSMNRVVLGRRMDTEYELVSGVENGSQVVVAGQSRLNDGMEVELQK